MKTLLLTCLLAVSFAGPSRAVLTGPEAAVAAYFTAFKSGDLAAVAMLIHPEELSTFRATMLPLIRKGIDSVNEESDEEDRMAVRLFMRGDSMETIGSESPAEFFARFLNWVMALNPAMADAMRTANVRTLGEVQEGDLSHVVYRVQIKAQDGSVDQVSVMTAKHYEEEWKLLLTAEVEGMADMLRMNLDQLPGPQ